jgi:hypothetical protein
MMSASSSSHLPTLHSILALDIPIHPLSDNPLSLDSISFSVLILILMFISTTNSIPIKINKLVLSPHAFSPLQKNVSFQHFSSSTLLLPYIHRINKINPHSNKRNNRMRWTQYR